MRNHFVVVPIVLAAIAVTALSARNPAGRSMTTEPLPETTFAKPSDDQLKKTLTPIQYLVTQKRRNRTAVPQRVLEQPRSGDLR